MQARMHLQQLLMLSQWMQMQAEQYREWQNPDMEKEG